jgi:hypothetical protein
MVSEERIGDRPVTKWFDLSKSHLFSIVSNFLQIKDLRRLKPIMDIIC